MISFANAKSTIKEHANPFEGFWYWILIVDLVSIGDYFPFLFREKGYILKF